MAPRPHRSARGALLRLPQRLLVAILMVLVLGVQFVNSLSSSHTPVAHRHAEGNGHAGKADDHHGHAQLIVKEKAALPHVHSHQHDLGDHTHDLALRRVLSDVQFSLIPSWHTEALIPFRSVVVHPLERPPKLLVIASSV